MRSVGDGVKDGAYQGEYQLKSAVGLYLLESVRAVQHDAGAALHASAATGHAPAVAADDQSPGREYDRRAIATSQDCVRPQSLVVRNRSQVAAGEVAGGAQHRRHHRQQQQQQQQQQQRRQLRVHYTAARISQRIRYKQAQGEAQGEA